MNKERDVTEKKTPVAIPYIHGISHRLKRLAEKNDVRVLFSAPSKLKGMCGKVNGR